MTIEVEYEFLEMKIYNENRKGWGQNNASM